MSQSIDRAHAHAIQAVASGLATVGWAAGAALLWLTVGSLPFLDLCLSLCFRCFILPFLGFPMLWLTVETSPTRSLPFSELRLPFLAFPPPSHRLSSLFGTTRHRLRYQLRHRLALPSQVCIPVVYAAMVGASAVGGQLRRRCCGDGGRG